MRLPRYFIAFFIAVNTAVFSEEIIPTAMIEASRSLEAFKEAQVKAKIQDPELSYAYKKANLLASLLISPEGRLQSEYCPLLKQTFLSKPSLDYEMNMVRILDQLDDSWQPILDEFQSPLCSESQVLLSALLGRPITSQFTSQDSKVAALSALFSPYNQGSIGDCFAVAQLIRDHQEFYKHTLRDFKEIIERGYITCQIGNNKDYFFFLPNLPDDDLNKDFTISVNGLIEGSGLALFQAPGLIAAEISMEVNRVPGYTKEAIKKLFLNTSKKQIEVTAAKVIEMLAQVKKEHFGGNLENLIAQGNYAFSSLTCNPLLRAVESAFAAMAEDRPQDSTRSDINQSVLAALSSAFPLHSHDDSFKTSFLTHLNNSYRLIYNLNIPLNYSLDGSSKDGGFQMYLRNQENQAERGTRIETPKEFNTMIVQAINNTIRDLGSSAEKIGADVLHAATSSSFMKEVLWNFDPSNRKESDPVANFQRLLRTPMQACDGDNPYEVASIDTGHEFEPDVIAFTPTNMHELLKWCLNLAKTVPQELIPMNSPQHAFNFVPMNADLLGFVSEKVTAEQWMRQKLYVPGMKASVSVVGKDFKESFSNEIFHILGAYLPNQEAYQQLVSKLMKERHTVQSFSSHFLSGICKLLKCNQEQAYEFALIFDSLLFEFLPENLSSLIEDSAIRFAFTNWNSGVKDMYFCGFFNPRTQKIAFGVIEEDKTNLQPMDEKAWVNGQTWDVDPRPYAAKKLAI